MYFYVVNTGKVFGSFPLPMQQMLVFFNFCQIKNFNLYKTVLIMIKLFYLITLYYLIL